MHAVNFYFPGVSIPTAFGLLAAAVAEILRVRRPQARHRRAFEEAAGRIIGVDECVAFSANRSGLFALLSALDIGPGDEVLITGYTCSAVPEPILQRGAVPVYVDLAPGSYSLDPDALEAAVTSRTRAVILQHTYGFAGPIERVAEFARARGLFFVEDCALAFGSRKDGRWLGTYGDAGVWSFELSKTLSVGWGGLLALRDPVLAAKVRAVRGRAGLQGRGLAARRLLQGGLSGLLYHHAMPGLIRRYALGACYKFGLFRASADTPASDLRLPADVQWKFLLRQMHGLDALREASARARRAYEAILSTHDCPSEAARLGPGADLIRFPIQVRDARRFVEFFAARGIEAGRWFGSPVSGGEPSRYGYVPGACPVAEEVALHIVNLPLHGRLTRRHIDSIASTLDDYLRAYPDEADFIRGRAPTKV